MEQSSLGEGITIGCGCAPCQSGQPVLVADYDSQFQTQDNPLYAPSTAATPQQFANYLTHGYWQDTGSVHRSWDQSVVTFSLSNEFTASQKAGLQMAFDLWADVADISFSLVSSGADITILEGDDGRAYSSSSRVGNTITSNTISIDTNVGGWSAFNDIGDYALMTAIHEIGHSLGLGHTGNYNGSATFANDAQWTNDSHQMTVMSYFNDTNVGSDHWDINGQWQYSASPMLIDILAIQNIYGADYTTRSGNTTYGFNSNAGRAQFDFSQSEAPVAIWDGGGTDTLDLSGYLTNQTIYLTEGAFSSVGNMTNNLVIAYGAVIENAIGGGGHDTIYGNDANNILRGGFGNDILHGSLGNDTLNGEEGTDTVTYSYSVTDFAFTFLDTVSLSLRHLTQGFTDLIQNIENFIFAGTSFTFDALESAYGDLETVALRFYFDGQTYAHNSETSETLTQSADDMGYAGASGNQFRLIRSGYETTVTILNPAAPNSIRLTGSAQDDTLTLNGTHATLGGRVNGGDGNDTITLSSVIGGNFTLDGGIGNDTITAGAGADLIHGRAGDDILSGGAGADRLYGYEDNDTLNGDAGNDTLYGMDGNDILNGGADNDRLMGGNHDDTLNGDEGEDILYGDDGHDTLNGGTGYDRLYGGLGNDILNGGADSDKLYGEDGNDTINGDDGNDLIRGDAGDDILSGGLGKDLIQGGTGNDTLDGGDQNDRLYGEANDDILSGGSGADLLYGGDGLDRLNGGAGHDILRGDAGNDILIDGDGQDSFYGGAGQDVFGLVVVDTLYDQFRDFILNGVEHDFINITDVLDGYTHGVSDINDFVMINFKHADRSDLFINHDGSGNDWQLTAVIRGSDFTGVTVNDLLSSGQLIANQSLL